MRPHPLTVVTALAALAGGIFAAVSTYDFVAHLDRQVHGLHCSYLPGIAGAETADTGCHVTLMSEYSSVFRDELWGGLPIALPAMGVFAFILFWALALAVIGREDDRRGTLFLALSTLLPVIASAVMGYISLTVLGAACKLCVGIYVSSGVAFLAAVALAVRAQLRSGRGAFDERPGEPDPTAATALRPTPRRPELSYLALAGMFALGVAFVVIPSSAYGFTAPRHEGFIGACGQLEDMEDEGGALLSLGPPRPGVPAIEVVDPLCPACRGFEQRYASVPASGTVSRRVLLFPLDDECNWMIDEAVHPGACAVSEAMICAENDAGEVLEWAFEQQDAILAATRSSPDAAASMARERFPQLADCIGSAEARARLNLALRWAVDHSLPVITPQLYVGRTRVCDADTDLGLDYVLTRLVERTPTESAPPAARPLIAEGGGRGPVIAPTRQDVATTQLPPPSLDPLAATDEEEAAVPPSEGAPSEGAPSEAPPSEAVTAEPPAEEASPTPATPPAEPEAPAEAPAQQPEPPALEEEVQ